MFVWNRWKKKQRAYSPFSRTRNVSFPVLEMLGKFYSRRIFKLANSDFSYLHECSLSLSLPCPPPLLHPPLPFSSLCVPFPSPTLSPVSFPSPSCPHVVLNTHFDSTLGIIIERSRTPRVLFRRMVHLLKHLCDYCGRWEGKRSRIICRRINRTHSANAAVEWTIGVTEKL